MGILLTAQKLKKSYTERLLFESLSFVISSQEKIGLIGPNGAGKSTLLKILAGKEVPDGGDVIPSRNLRMRYLSQTPEFKSNQSVFDALAEDLGHLDDWERDLKVNEIFWQQGLESTELQLEKPVSALSGGWKKRLAILRELIHEPDLLLMDEPTNHLDVEGILWLEALIQSSKFACLTITHDRYFLDRVANRILEVDRRHEDGILSVNGNYTRYLEVKEALMEAQENREASLRGVLRRETEWLKAGVKARTTKQEARIQRHSELNKEVSELARRNKKQNVDMAFQSSDEKPKRLLEAKQISKAFSSGAPLFKKLDVLLTPGTCIGILGENGCGKSSLIRVLLGEEKPDEGKIFHSDLLEVAYFEQGKEKINPKLSVMRSVCPDGDQVFYQGRPVHIRSYLERFLFQQEKMDLPVGSLSGGEQSRLLLAKLMLTEANLLVLDEPTNDLDIPTLNVLEDCIKEFDGAVLLVTHDRFFLDRCSSRLLAFPPKGSHQMGQLQYLESFDQWNEWYRSFQKADEKKSHKENSPKKETPKAKPLSSKETDVMKKIEKAETELKKLEEECASPEIASDLDALQKKGDQMAKLQEKISQLWDELR